ncbi:MAG: DUF1385 domain-containing protein [Clostridia bacterium]|nr:DUF1385 domain-containing protein [Clostridia bacterium]
MMRGPHKTAMAVRHTSGEIVIKEWDNGTGKTPKILKLPIIRGVYNFIMSMKIGYKCLMESAEMSGLEDEEPVKGSDVTNEANEDVSDSKPEATENKQEEKKSDVLMNVLMVIASVLGVALALVLFMYLPTQIFSWLAKAFPVLEGRFLRSLFEGILRIVIFVLYMYLVSLMKDIRRTFMYHGAEHKTIYCYESGLELTVENVRGMQRFHPRCGTSFMILMLIVGIVISMFISVTNPFLRTLIKLALLPLTVGIGYELIKIAGRHDNLLTRIISLPGVWLQHISVLEPDDSMIECAIEAVNRVIPDDGSDTW